MSWDLELTKCLGVVDEVFFSFLYISTLVNYMKT